MDDLLWPIHPETIAEDINENLEAGLESFREIMMKLNSKWKLE